MLEVLLVIAPLFLIIFFSAILQKAGGTDENWSNVLNKYALDIGFPALIFAALAKTNFSFSQELDLIVANSIFLLSGFLIAYTTGKLLRFNKKTLRTFFICLVFGNVAYLGIPTLIQISGESILPTASVIVAIYLFWIFTIGIGYLDYSQKKNKKDLFKDVFLNLFKNPLLIAVVLGILVASLKIPIPDILMQSIDMIAKSVTPIVLVIIGLFIGRSKIGKIRDWIPIFIFSLTILIILPTLFFLGLKLSGHSTTQFSASIIEAAMPLAITPFALADEYKLNKKFIAHSIALSTILSVVTIPFWSSVL